MTTRNQEGEDSRMPTSTLESSAGAAEPLAWRASFPGEPCAVSAARAAARHQVAAWGYAPGVVEAVELVMSELASNAVRYACRGSEDAFQAGLTAGPHGVTVQVSDGEVVGPHCLDASPEAEHGRGLLIVASCSLRWGVTATGGQGKQTWSLIQASPPPSVLAGRDALDDRRRAVKRNANSHAVTRRGDCQHRSSPLYIQFALA